MDTDDLTPRVIVRVLLGGGTLVAAAALVLVLIAARYIEWRLVTLVLVLWSAYGFFDTLMDSAIEPLGRFFTGQFVGGEMPAETRITIAQETATLERLVAVEPSGPAHRVVLAGIRLAEIYRTCQHDPAKADALLARLTAQFPDAPELKYVPPPATD
ncbi:MAG TPA: hypothetical protein VH116_09985 [Gemmatimonadales bacterium]|jgi:hypothetical protein|nr:hypothetical protein [Gemmatimonadales bacterium]